MPLIERRFLRSLYLTLALACTCLGYAEFEFLPWIGVFTAVVLVLLGAAYRLEEGAGRYPFAGRTSSAS